MRALGRPFTTERPNLLVVGDGVLRVVQQVVDAGLCHTNTNTQTHTYI